MPQSRDRCTIELSGWFDLDWASYVGDMLVHEQVEQGAIRNTTLVGHPVDLEAFLGILHMLIDRGFSVQAFEYQHATSGEAVVGDSPLKHSTSATMRQSSAALSVGYPGSHAQRRGTWRHRRPNRVR